LPEGDKSGSMNGAAPAASQTRLDPTPAGAVFISYASQDTAVADALCAALEREGVLCWLAPRNVRPGDFYADAIVHAINACPVLVLVLSHNSVGSAHVLREVERASAKKRPVVAFRIDAAPLPPGLEYFLSASQWIDASTGPIERGIPKLVESLRSRIALTPTTEFKPRLALRPPFKKRLSRSVIAMLVVVAAALAYFLADKFWLGTRAKAQQPTSATTSPVGDKSIAVLPFTDMSEKKDQEYFADGMAEEIIDLLVKIPGLKVIGRTSSFQFKGKNADLRTIGTELNAAYVLEGSVRTAGDQVRITAQLINTQTGTHEWSETYDRHIGDVLKLQDSIAAAVARKLQLTVADRYLISRSTVKSADAYDLMLRGRHAADRWDQEGLNEAAAFFQQALDRDFTSADAAAELAWTYESQGEFGYLAPAVAFEQARRAAATALKLDPKTAEAHAVLGRIHIVYDWAWDASKKEFQQAATLAPGSEDVLNGEAVLSLALGRCDDALRQITAALAQDPLDPTNFVFLSLIQSRRGHLREADGAIRRVLDIRPNYDSGHYLLGILMLARGDREGALLQMQQETNDEAKQHGLAIVYYALGRKAESDSALAYLLKEQAADSAFDISEVYASRGQPDEAMRWLERAYAQKDVSLYYIKGELPLKNLQSDPRYKAFLRKMHLPE